MTESTLVPIRYREFYDVPRAIVVEFDKQLYFLDCKFDNDADDYSQYYDVFNLVGVELADLDDLDWSTLPERGDKIGQMAVANVRFDESRRKYIDGSELKQVIDSQA